MTDTIAPPIELTWESKEIEVGRIRTALAEQWRRWEAEFPDPSIIEPNSTEQVYMRASTVNVIVAVDTKEDAKRAQESLSQLSDYSPSRLLILVRNGRPANAKTYSVRVKVEEREHTRGVAPVRLETISILAPPGNDQSLASLSSPLLIPDLPDVLYVPFGPIANNLLVSSLFELVDILVVDTVWTPDSGASFAVREQPKPLDRSTVARPRANTPGLRFISRLMDAPSFREWWSQGVLAHGFNHGISATNPPIVLQRGSFA